MKTINLEKIVGTNGVIYIECASCLYAKNKTALSDVLRNLKQEGYTIKKTEKNKVQKEDVWPLWKAIVNDNIVYRKHQCIKCHNCVDFVKNSDDTLECPSCKKTTTHRVVKLYCGNIYQTYQTLPIPTYFRIFEAWHWAPLGSYPKLHEKIIHAVNGVARMNFYDANEASDFTDLMLQGMRTFVENFTTLDVSEWDKIINNMPNRNGKTIILAIANFYHDNPIARYT